MSRFVHKTLAVAALAAFVPSFAAAAQHHSRIDEKIQAQQQKLHGLHVQLHQKQAKLEDAKAKVGSIQAQLADTNHNIAIVNAHVNELQAQMRSTQRKLAWNKIQLAAAQATLRRHQDALDRRLVDAYEHGDLGYVDVLLRARSFADFIERWNDIRFLVKANEATIRARRADQAHVAAIQNGLLGTAAELQNQQAQVDQQKRALDALAVQRSGLLAVADNERQQAQSEVQELDNMSEQEQAALNTLVAEKQAELEAERQARRRAAQLAGQDLPPEPGAPGSLMWPVSGPITSPFGSRMHPVYHRIIFHGGIDIAVPTGTTVAAAATGRVIIASYQGDCGNMVAIDHGGGLSTIYCHLSQIYVGAGQDVQRGQAIGAAGMTGDATGPHVHFQVDLHGTPVDPMGYLH